MVPPDRARARAARQPAEGSAAQSERADPERESHADAGSRAEGPSGAGRASAAASERAQRAARSEANARSAESSSSPDTDAVVADKSPAVGGSTADALDRAQYGIEGHVEAAQGPLMRQAWPSTQAVGEIPLSPAASAANQAALQTLTASQGLDSAPGSAGGLPANAAASATLGATRFTAGAPVTNASAGSPSLGTPAPANAAQGDSLSASQPTAPGGDPRAARSAEDGRVALATRGTESPQLSRSADASRVSESASASPTNASRSAHSPLASASSPLVGTHPLIAGPLGASSPGASSLGTSALGTSVWGGGGVGSAGAAGGAIGNGFFARSNASGGEKGTQFHLLDDDGQTVSGAGERPQTSIEQVRAARLSAAGGQESAGAGTPSSGGAGAGSTSPAPSAATQPGGAHTIAFSTPPGAGSESASSVVGGAATGARIEVLPAQVRAVPFTPDGDIDGPALTQRVARIVRRSAGEGGGSVQLRLDPPQLGRVDLEVRMSGERVDLHFRVDHEGVRDALLAGVRELHESLEGYGLRTGGFTVDVRDGESPTGQGSGQGNGRQDRHAGDPGANGGTETDPGVQRWLRPAHLGSALDAQG